MKKNLLGSAITNIAYRTAQKEANQVCQWLFYQDAQPDKVKNLKKIK